MQTKEELCHCQERNDEAISENSEIATPFGLEMTAYLLRLL